VILMAKYSKEFKLKVVLEYLEGPMGYLLLARKHEIRSRALIQRWVRIYNAFGEDGLKTINKKQSYPVQFKLDVLNFMKQTGASYLETAIHFKITNPTLIAYWNSNLGIEGRKEKRENPSMPKKTKKILTEQDQNQTLTREQLEREVEALRLEVAYLKKLNAFQENPGAFLEKYKQQSHSNLKKKDSN
jgi:transposase